MEVGGCRPVSNRLDLDRVHFDMSFPNDYSEVFHFLFVEMTLFRLQEKVMFSKFAQDMSDHIVMVVKTSCRGY
jgi:hypothetical protein